MQLLLSIISKSTTVRLKELMAQSVTAQGRAALFPKLYNQYKPILPCTSLLCNKLVKTNHEPMEVS